VASERPSTFQAARPEALVTLDFASLERAVTQARAFHAVHPVTAALGVDDATSVAAAAINEGLGRPGNPVAAAAAARDKREQRVRCAAAGVPVPAFAVHALDGPDPARPPRFPCVVKPLRLAASRGVIRADDPAALDAALQRVRRILADPALPDCGDAGGQVLLEEFVPGPEVALEGLLRDGRLHVLALFDKPDPLEGPFFEESIYVTPSRLPAAAQRDVAAIAQAACAALGLREGAVHAELRVAAQGVRLIEIAARPIGGRCSAALRFGAQGDVSLEEIICRHALGLALPALEREPRASGVMMLPVPGPGVLREVRGVAAARAVPLIVDVQITAHARERLVPWPEGSRYPGFLFARGDTPAAVEAALRDAQRRLDFVLDADPT
jgi:biotin carboxylase